MPAALTFPIGSRFYDWKYESEPEPHMHDRRIYHARGKVLGGSSSINGMIFQRGNPLDYERWGADPGMETWDYAHCLPYFKRMENCLEAALDDPYRGHSGPLVLERGPADNPLFGAFFEAVQQAGLHLTEDVNGYRQEGFGPFDRNVHRGRRLSAARAYLHPIKGRPNLELHTRAFVRRVLFEGTRAVGVEYTRGGRTAHRVRRRGDPGRRRVQLAADAAGVGRGERRRASRARASTSCTTCPASASTSRTTWRCTSSTRARSRCRWRRTSSGAGVRGSGSSGCSSAAGRARRTTSRAAGSRAATRTSRTRT